MTSALWRQRSDVLICLLIQTMLIVIGLSLQSLQLRDGGKTTLDNHPVNEQQADSFPKNSM